MDNSRRTIDIDCKSKSLWTEDNALCLMDQKGVIYYELLKPGETVNTECYPQMINLNQACVKNNRNIKKGNTK